MQILEQYVEEKDPMIIHADTVVNPLAMMVVSLDTFVAEITMPGVWSAVDLALRTQTIRINQLNYFAKVFKLS